MAKIFGEYLIEKGLLTEEQFLEALNSQSEHKRLLGKMALQKGLISNKDLFKILTKQRASKDPRENFGTIAVDLGLLSESQINQLLEEQNTDQSMIGEIVIQKGYINKEKLPELLRMFQSQKNSPSTGGSNGD